MDDDFVDVFPSAGGVGDSPVKAPIERNGSTWPRLAIPLSIPGIDTGGGAPAVSPAILSRGIATTSNAKGGVLGLGRTVSGGRDEADVSQDNGSPTPSPHLRLGERMAPILTIDPGGECVPTELEKKRAKLEKYRYVCSEVSDSFMYVAGEDAAKQEGLVLQVGVTHIINCAGPQCPNYLEYTGRFEFLRLDFYDHRTEDVAWFIYSAFDFIKAAESKGGRVLIHCVQGVSRSCTLAIAWLMLTTGMDYEEAYVLVRQGRPICAPNTGFICSLLEWQRRREQPQPLPLLYRTAWHVPFFPNDLVLKICLHEEDRKYVKPVLAALDSRGCYVLAGRRASTSSSRESYGAARAPKHGPEAEAPVSSAAAAAVEAGLAAQVAAGRSSGSTSLSSREETNGEGGGVEDMDKVEEEDSREEYSEVEVFVWRGSDSDPRMLECARQGARWLRDYEGWGVGISAPVIDEGKEPEEFSRHLAGPGTNTRQPPAYGDLTSPSSPPPRIPIATPSTFHQPLATPSIRGGAAIPSPAEPPMLSPAGPSPSPGGAGNVFSPYSCGVSPAGMCGERSISPAGSVAVSPATPSIFVPGGDYILNPPFRRCSIASAAGGDEDDEDEIGDGIRHESDRGVRGGNRKGGDEMEEADHRSEASGHVLLLDSSHTKGDIKEIEAVPDYGRRVGAVAEGSPPCLFELSKEPGGHNASGLRWSQLNILDDQQQQQQPEMLQANGEDSHSQSPNTGRFGDVRHMQEHQPMSGCLLQVQALARDAASVEGNVREGVGTCPRVSDVDAALLVSGNGNEPEAWWDALERSCV